MKGLISCSVACRFYDIPTGKCRLKCEKKSNPDAEFYDDCPLPDAVEVKHACWKAVYPPDTSLRDLLFRCSRCGHYEFKPRQYCADCGAKMQQEGEKDGN